MKPIVLDSSTSIIAVLGGAVATDQPEYIAMYIDRVVATGVRTEGYLSDELNSTTPVTIVAAPAAGTLRTVTEISILNIDTADIALTVQVDGGTARHIAKAKTIDANTGMWVLSTVGVTASSGGGMVSFTVAGDGGTNQSITDGNTLTIAGGTNIATVVSATDTVTVNFDGTLPIASGGTGQTTQQAAIDALTNVSAATNEYVLTKDTSTGNAIFKAPASGGSVPALFKEGLKLDRVSASVLSVGVGSVVVNSTLVNKSSATELDLATAANWIGGSSLESASEWVSVYAKADGTLLLSDKLPNIPTAAAPIADMQVNEAGWIGTAGNGLNETIIAYDNDTGEGSVTAGMYALFYSDAAFTIGAGKGSATASSLNYQSMARIVSIDTGANTITVEAGHNIAIFDDYYIMIVDSQQLIYRDVSGTYYRHIGAWWNDASSNLVSINNQYGLNQEYHSAAIVINEASDYTTSSTSFVAVDATNLNLSIITTGKTLRIDFNGSFFSPGTNGRTYADVELDGFRILGDDGSLVKYIINWSTYALNLNVPGLLPGNHTVKLMWSISNQITTLYAGAGTSLFDLHPQLSIYEVSND